MRIIAALMLAMLAAPVLAAEPDPYGPPPPPGTVDALMRKAAFGEPGADMALSAWLAANPDADEAVRRRVSSSLCNHFGVRTWALQRSEACASARADGGDADGGMAAAFRNVPPVRAIGSARVPLSWNPLGSQNADVTVNGVTSSWFMDTGAEITVLVQSVADRMGVRYVGEGIRVGTTTADVHGGVGVIDLMKIGEAWVENVPVLVLPDAQLTIGGTHRIDGILGLQVFVAFGRVAWTDGGQTLALGEAAPRTRPDAPRLHWHEEGLGIPVGTTQGVMAAHLDTGANGTDLRPDGLVLLTPEQLASATTRKVRVGGAGGVVERDQRNFGSLQLEIAGSLVVSTDVGVVENEGGSAARVGMDVVSQFGEFILDFDQMRLDGRLKTPEEQALPGPSDLNPEAMDPNASAGSAQGT